MEDKRSNVAPISIAVLLLLVTGYVAGYYALVKPEFTSPEEHGIARIPTYRTGWSQAERVFYPMHMIDRKVRSSYWYYDFDNGSPPKWLPGG